MSISRLPLAAGACWLDRWCGRFAGLDHSRHQTFRRDAVDDALREVIHLHHQRVDLAGEIHMCHGAGIAITSPTTVVTSASAIPWAS